MAKTPRAAAATTRRLLAVFVLLGVLALGGVAAVAYYARVVIPDSYARVWQTERLSRQVSSLLHRADEIGVLLAHAVPTPATLSDDEVAQIELHRSYIRASMAELRREADEHELAQIDALTPTLEAYLDSAMASVRAVKRQDAVRFEHEVETQVLPRLTELVNRGDALTVMYAERSMTSLQRMNRKIDALGIATLIFGGIFVAILLAGSIASLRLLTARDRAIADQLERLERVNSDLEAFAGRVAHDLRGPLMPILLAAATLKERPGDRDMTLTVAARVERSVNRAVRLIDSLLAFSRAAEPSSEMCNGAAIIDEVVEEMREAATRQGVRLELDIAPVDLVIAPTLFHQIVQNLLANAIRFAGHLAPPSVGVALHRRDGAARLSVWDNGPGIPRSERERVFEPFYRLEYHEGGAGLGLATVRRVVQAHGGHCGVDERDGGGAVVWVALPCAPPDKAPAAPREPVRATG